MRVIDIAVAALAGGALLVASIPTAHSQNPVASPKSLEAPTTPSEPTKRGHRWAHTVPGMDGNIFYVDLNSIKLSPDKKNSLGAGPHEHGAAWSLPYREICNFHLRLHRLLSDRRCRTVLPSISAGQQRKSDRQSGVPDNALPN
jgi:hypothetical protein